MRFLKNDHELIRLILKIALPVSAQNLVTFLVGMMDTVMLGKLGEVELSASALANQLFFIFTITGFGIANGANILISQYWGKRDSATIRRIFSLAYKLSLVLSVLFACLAFFAPKYVMSVFTNDPAVIAEGIRYLRIITPCFLAYGITSATTIMLRGIQTVNIAILVNLTSLVTNVFFNWVFIFGNLGAPKMGVAGAALATLIARLCELLIVLPYMAFFENKIKLRIKHLLSFDKSLLPDFKRHVLPVTLNEVLWSLGASAISMIIGRMGTEYVAANSISSVLNQLVTIVIFGMASSSAVIIGNTIGQGKHELALQRARSFMLLAFIMGVVAGLATLLVRPLVISIYNVSPATKEIAMQIMAVAALVVFFQSMAATSMMGVLRGGGDVKFVMFADIIFLWLVAVPLGSVAGLALHLPVWAVFMILKCDEALKTALSYWRISSGKWVRDVTR